MKYLFINGSPNEKRGNTEIFIRQLQKGMHSESDVAYVKGCDYDALAKEIANYDACIIVMPLYVFAMPGIVMKLMEAMSAYTYAHNKIGFIVQQGFDESCHSDFLLQYFPSFAQRLQFTYMGTMVKGGAAGTRWMNEKANEQLFQNLKDFASDMESNLVFTKEWIDAFADPYRLSHKRLRLYRLLEKLHLTRIMWYLMLIKNHAFSHRLDTPYV